MNIDKHFASEGGDYLKSSDIGTSRPILTMDACEIEKMTDRDGKEIEKPCLSFKGKNKKLVLNKTNGTTIRDLYGPDTSRWVDQMITLFVCKVQMSGGGLVDGIRIEPHAPSPGRANERLTKDRQVGNAEPAAAPVAPSAEYDDDVPF